ncbi:TPA: S-methyl-5-thioribose-1-phosphate isomerase [archaeon]|uniref:Putative methylthioribose-1-phosphate isomerase n=1 Tax=Candidatus Naiadarchaeum limnaeum TaxID=2756139 RepID=A0A832UZF2_9ARCH|nr:S-methyl-5-thioribose-1-phosphate isomerase [Candidatus Naiadarchaeales archaeon SRR2090153.bin1042]HIK00124.1 S-methyl-5-thioribose-1-phosphate isomerase [Candidatus Naiadarchaeum limnaeum]
MKIRVGGKTKNYRTVWFENRSVKLIDQTKLPFKFSIYSAKTYKQTREAIRNMIVRGAPAIGATAAFATAQAALEFKGKDLKKFFAYMRDAARFLKTARPTAIDLAHAVDRVLKIIKKAHSVREAKTTAVFQANLISREYIKVCERIGKNGEKLIHSGAKILTHCNAGALATVDIGTALAPIRFAHNNGKRIFVFVDETRPRLQGSKLTAWELAQEKIPHAVIADNAAGLFMQRGDVDICIVGADRIAANGDTANKIGTYEKAVLARENGIPFYIAAPLTTFDFKTKSGEKIPIEFRADEEVLYATDGKTKVPISNLSSKVKNPGFDVTPARYINGYITEFGVFTAKNLKKLRKF